MIRIDSDLIIKPFSSEKGFFYAERKNIKI